jgi:hypothetical protein
MRQQQLEDYAIGPTTRVVILQESTFVCQIPIFES